MSSRLPRTRSSRPTYRPRIGIGPASRETIARLDVEYRRRLLSDRCGDIGARLDRDPNGYAIAQGGRFVARCANLDAVEAWIVEQDRSAERKLFGEG